MQAVTERRYAGLVEPGHYLQVDREWRRVTSVTFNRPDVATITIDGRTTPIRIAADASVTIRA